MGRSDVQKNVPCVILCGFLLCWGGMGGVWKASRRGLDLTRRREDFQGGRQSGDPDLLMGKAESASLIQWT